MTNSANHYRVVFACDGVPRHAGPWGAIDITEEFTHRPWHQNSTCMWDGQPLILQRENDFDPEGLALMDEFSDAVAACITGLFDGSIRVVSTTTLPIDPS